MGWNHVWSGDSWFVLRREQTQYIGETQALFKTPQIEYPEAGMPENIVHFWNSLAFAFATASLLSKLSIFA